MLERYNSLFPKFTDFILEWIYNRNEYTHLKYVLTDVKREDLIDKTIVFNTVRSIKNIIDREFFLAKILAMKNAKIIMLLDDGILKHWDTSQIDRLKDFKNFKAINYNPYPVIHRDLKNFIQKSLNINIIRRALKSYRDSNLKIYKYSELIDEIKYINCPKLKKYAKSSTIRFFKNSELDYQDDYVNFYYNLSLKNALISRNIGVYVLNKLKPDLYITSHGIYSTWGPAYDLLKENGIRSLVYASKHSHSRDIHDVYFTDAKVQTLSRSSAWKDYKDKLVTVEMETKVKQLFQDRIKHITKDTKVYYEKESNLLEIDKNDGFQYHLAIFPNLIWDGNIDDRHEAFDGIIDWLVSTINYLKKRKDIKFYIKFHPAEVTMFKKSPKIQDILEQRMNLNEIDNLILISSESNIDSYQFLMKGIDLAICYDGILALEIPLLKIPTILGGVGGRFSVEGGNYTINKKEDYFYYLDNLQSTINEFHDNYLSYYKNIIRYAYWYLFENVMKLPIFSDRKKYLTDLMQLRKKDIYLNKKLYRIIN